MHMTKLKIAGLTALTIALTTGTAFAGDKKDCDHKKQAAMKTEATTAQKTDVLSAAEHGDAMTHKAKAAKMRKAYSVEDATKICQEKGVEDLDACVAHKTGHKTKPKS